MKALVPMALGLSAAFALGCTPEGSVDAPVRVDAPVHPVDAEFRYQAGVVYEELVRPSCAGAAEGFDRASMLRNEAAAIAAFEDASRTKPQYFHLTVARADTAHTLSQEGGCSADSDLDFALLHVEHARGLVPKSLAIMRSLEPSRADQRPAVVALATDAAPFRFRVRDLERSIRRMCRLSNRADNSEILGPSRREVSEFKRGLAGSPYAAHYQIAEDDVTYYQSFILVECANPSAAPPETLRANALAETKARIAAIEALITP